MLPPQQVRCIDGDTVEIDEIVYRLSYIDTPEKREAGWQEAKDFTCDFLNENRVKITTHGKGFYGRVLAELHYKDISLNEELIKMCLAEPYYVNTTDKIKDFYSQYCLEGEIDD